MPLLVCQIISRSLRSAILAFGFGVSDTVFVLGTTIAAMLHRIDMILT